MFLVNVLTDITLSANICFYYTPSWPLCNIMRRKAILSSVKIAVFRVIHRGFNGDDDVGAMG
uniref:Secreted protein n=1 Tax=Heterorhabditis bacteriophora TaxID=37862 RepID=A0A1I7X723_HETBA